MPPAVSLPTALRRLLLTGVGALGWGVFGCLATFHIVWNAAHPRMSIAWLYDWHVYWAGAIDFVERDLYRGPLLLPGWPLPTPVFNQPPGAAILAVPFLPLGHDLASLLWLAIGLAALLAAVVATIHLAKVRQGWAIAGAGLLVYADRTMVGHTILGNVNFVVLAILVGFAWSHLAMRQRTAGALLGAAIAIKLWPLALLPLLVREARWTEIRWAAAIVVVQGVFVLSWLGADVVPDLVAALRTDLPIPRGASFMWTTWAREVLGLSPWIGPALAAAILLIPARGALGIGLGLVAGLSMVNNLWDHYMTTFALAAVLIFMGLRDRSSPAHERADDRLGETARPEVVSPQA